MSRSWCLALLLAGCGSGDPGGTPDAAVIDASSSAKIYFPLAVGATWTYQVTDPLFPSAPPTTKVQTVDIRPGGWAFINLMALR